MSCTLELPLVLLVLLLTGLAALPAGAETPHTLFITNDTCPDYTWGLTEVQARQAFADLVRSHLDEMTRTDSLPPDQRSRYNMAVTEEALCFLERYPNRREELIRRLREGRLLLSPFLCNTLWGFQSVEGALRALYPARRLEAEWGVPIDVAEHIEEPSLPWGMASVLAGSGIRWVSVPFLDYDCTFGALKSPPIFDLRGPDGRRVRVVMDAWASEKANYTQGAAYLKASKEARQEWLRHYAGPGYPFPAVLASGTHGDISPGSGGQARGFTEAIQAASGDGPRLVNATLRQFADAVDGSGVPVPLISGCFGHSWELWPVSLAKVVAELRSAERRYLAAESLAALASWSNSGLARRTEALRRRAEWCWAMLGDHAWNGTDDANRKVNADLRRGWARGLEASARELEQQAWSVLGVSPRPNRVTLFNPLSTARAELLSLPVPTEVAGAAVGLRASVPSQVVQEEGRRLLYCVSPRVTGFGTGELRLSTSAPKAQPSPRLSATPTSLEGPYYSLRVDPATGAVTSLVHKASRRELVASANGRGLFQPVYHDGKDHGLTNVRTEVAALGPVLARLRVTGSLAGGTHSTTFTLYSALDRLDVDARVSRPASKEQQRLCHLLPLSLGPEAVLRVETPGAVVRPRLQPEGDLLPGADTRRMAVQCFVDVSLPEGPGVTVAPLDAFALRMDPGALAFEALGNDQNYREVTQDQGGDTEFRYRYSLRAHAGPYRQSEAVSWSRAVASPLLAVPGVLPDPRASLPSRRAAAPSRGGAAPLPGIDVPESRAVATCLKPSDTSGEGTILRLWETAGHTGPVTLTVRGWRRAVLTDLLERDKTPLPISAGKLRVPLAAWGMTSVRLK